MSPTVLLDAFCKAGGASEGYRRAGFYVIGVDHEPQPNYAGDEFILADAIDVLAGDLSHYDAIHASPPCQFGTAYLRRPNHVRPSDNLIPVVRAHLARFDGPWVIENTYSNRKHLIDPVMYCGSSFGLNVQRQPMICTRR